MVYANPNLRECDDCGHAWGEHRLDDTVTPPQWPCMHPGCDCKSFRSPNKQSEELDHVEKRTPAP